MVAVPPPVTPTGFRVLTAMLRHREHGIDGMLDASGVTAYFSRNSNRGNQWQRQLQHLCQMFFTNPEISLRTAGQAIHHLGLTLASLRPGREPYALESVIAMILKTVDYGLYNKFILGEVTAADIIDRITRMPGLEEGEKIQGMYLFEATVILAYQGLSMAKSDIGEMASSPMLERYRELAAKEASDTHARNELLYPARIVQAVEGHHRQYALAENAHKAIQRIELLSGDLATL